MRLLHRVVSAGAPLTHRPCGTRSPTLSRCYMCGMIRCLPRTRRALYGRGLHTSHNVPPDPTPTSNHNMDDGGTLRDDSWIELPCLSAAGGHTCAGAPHQHNSGCTDDSVTHPHKLRSELAEPTPSWRHERDSAANASGDTLLADTGEHTALVEELTHNVMDDDCVLEYAETASAAAKLSAEAAVDASDSHETVAPHPHVLYIPDKHGAVRETVGPPLLSSTANGQPSPPSPRARREVVELVAPLDAEDTRRPCVRTLRRGSYLAQQDRLYLAPRTPPVLQAPLPDGLCERRCVLVAFAQNDLRVEDNYILALAATAAHDGGGLPVVALCVLDYRQFAQPSVVAAFYRQSPQRAQYLLDTVQALRVKLERELHVPLLVRCGRPEEHVPRLAAELQATDVFLTTQYAPHERYVHDTTLQRLRAGCWVSRTACDGDGDGEHTSGSSGGDHEEEITVAHEHHDGRHPYGLASGAGAVTRGTVRQPHRRAHSVWQSTLVHADDLPTPVAAMKEGERWYHDDVTVATIRPTRPYTAATRRLRELPRWSALLPADDELGGAAPVPALRGALPTLAQLGYGDVESRFNCSRLIATQNSHLPAGEDAALAHVHAWLAEGGMTSYLRYGRERRTNTKMYSGKLARVSAYISVGAISPRKLYELLRQHAQQQQRDGFVQMQFREALLRLSRRDYCHWMGLRYGARLFFSYGPRPEQTDNIPNWRLNAKVIQRWCYGLTGIPFADAAMSELVSTGFVAHEGRQALAWLLTRGYGQDWRVGAEWLERCSLDYDPFICYMNFAYFSELLLDDYGEPVRTVHYLAHQHDQTGIYIKRWLPQLSRVPPVYIHRPHILTARMQALLGVKLGHNYPYPIKLWDGATQTLSAHDLTSYFSAADFDGPGYAEAVRHGTALLQPEEYSAAVSPSYIMARAWTQRYLDASYFNMDESDDMEHLRVSGGRRAAAAHLTVD